MKIISQNGDNKGQVLLGLISLGDSQIQELRIAVAYITKAGSDLLFDVLSNKVGKSLWDSIPKIVTTSFDFGFTEPAALTSLKQLSSCTVNIWGIEVLQNKRLQPVNSFHPKMYIFDKDGSISAFIGSANLSLSGLTTNTEAAIIYENVSNTAEINACWEAINSKCTPLTGLLLQQYREARKKYANRSAKPKVKKEKSAPVSGAVTRRRLSPFYQAISTGVITPQNYDHFWVEAGSMSSGGSGNQLELPRGANMFLGFNFSSYDGQHHTIGCPVIFSRDKVWSHKPLTWHGHNAMERINLPTVTQGGYSYKNTIVHFTRNNNRYELLVFPWSHPLSQIWRNRSQRDGLIFKLGIGSTRVCGLY